MKSSETAFSPLVCRVLISHVAKVLFHLFYRKDKSFPSSISEPAAKGERRFVDSIDVCSQSDRDPSLFGRLPEHPSELLKRMHFGVVLNHYEPSAAIA